MKSYIYLLNILIILLTFGCIKQQSIDNSIYMDIETDSKACVKIEYLELENIISDKAPMIYWGMVRVFNDTVYLIDINKSVVHLLNVDGDNFGLKLRQGRGPKEYDGGIIYDLLFNKKGEKIVLGTSWDIHRYSELWEKEGFLRIDWQADENELERLNNPKPEMRGLYSLTYDEGNDKLRLHESYFFAEIASFHPEFNMIVSRDYYRSSRIIAKINYNTGYVEEIMGIRSPVYEKYEFIGQFSRHFFDINPKNKEFYLSFQPDSLIYVVDMNFIPIRAFGYAGNNMNTDYYEYSGNDFGLAASIYQRETKTKGYYSGLEYISQEDVLFRSYIKGDTSNTDGLQIYRNEVLIGDVDVPKGFKVEGYIAPFFISNLIQCQESDSYSVYRFKLDHID